MRAWGDGAECPGVGKPRAGEGRVKRGERAQAKACGARKKWNWSGGARLGKVIKGLGGK